MCDQIVRDVSDVVVDNIGKFAIGRCDGEWQVQPFTHPSPMCSLSLQRD